MRSSISRWHRGLRIRIILIYIGLMIINHLRPFVLYGMETGKTATVFVLPLLFQGSTISFGTPKTILLLGYLALICDAPFIRRFTPYVIMRSSPGKWLFGQCLFLLLTAVLYTLFILTVSVLCLLPVCSRNNDWGEVFFDFAYGNQLYHSTDLMYLYGAMNIPYRIVIHFLPAGSTVYVSLVLILTFFILGLIVFRLSLISGSPAMGLSAGSFFIMLDPVLRWFSWPRYYWRQWFSPVCWCSIDGYRMVSPDYALTVQGVLGLSALLCIALVCLVTRTRFLNRFDIWNRVAER